MVYYDMLHNDVSHTGIVRTLLLNPLPLIWPQW